MLKKIFLISIIFSILLSSFCQCSNATSTGQISEGEISLSYRNVTVYAPAVARTDKGYIGVISTITVTIQNNGSGRVFVDTLPLTQVDMQGSARLAVKVACALVERDNISTDDYDFFFVVRTDAPIIGGPSAGAIMTVATVALLEGWAINNETVMTGMINPDGGIGPVGGIPQKIDAAYSVGTTRFLIPKGQDTYTEMETTVENGWTTRLVTKSVTEYAMENYGIEVVEVEDINEALHNFTGYIFPIAESDGKITIEGYVDAMKPLAETLLDDATNLYANASSLFANSTIPNYYFANYREQITEVLQDAKDRLEKSQKWYNQEMYYTSTTKSFLSLIDSRFVYYACEYFNSDDRNEYLSSLTEKVNSFYDNKSEVARNANTEGVVSLQCVGAAQKRVSEADGYLSDASNAFNDESYLTSIYYLATAMERSRSVGWWLGISSYFNDTVKINETKLDNLALEYIEDAKQSIIYSTIILQEIGKTSNYLTSAEELLECAQDDMKKDYPAAALFEALEALVKANLAIENIDDDAEGKIDRAKKRAGCSITESKNMGIKPVLAVSYCEYADSLVNESSFDSALFYYKYSGVIAGALGFTSFSSNASSSRYVGIPEIKYIPVRYNWLIEQMWLIVPAFIIGGVAGLGLGLIISGITSTREKEKTDKKWVPQSINDYRQKQKKQYYPDKQIPRSISDYYKKNK